MGVSIGRLREDKVYDYKFVGLSHNTVRGAAGGAVLCAETLKAKGYITRYNGNVTEVEEWGKKKLAYEIQKMHEGFYYFIQFEADATAPAEIESHMRIMDNVLRYLVVKKEA